MADNSTIELSGGVNLHEEINKKYKMKLSYRCLNLDNSRYDTNGQSADIILRK